MNSYIETITGPICKGLLRNIFVIAIRANAIKISDLRNKAFFDRYQSLIKGSKTLVQILLPAYLQSKAEMLFAIS